MSRRHAPSRARVRFACAACGGPTMGSPAGSGTLSACPECGWEDTAGATERPDEIIRPNYLALSEARRIAASIGPDGLRNANRAGHAGRNKG